MFYGRNAFVFTPKVTAVDGVGSIASCDMRWLAAIGKANAAFIRKMEVRWLGWCRRALLANFKDNLREMGVRVDQVEVAVACWTNEDRWSSGHPGTVVTSGTYLAP